MRGSKKPERKAPDPACGLDDAETGWLIDSVWRSTPTPTESMELFHERFERRADAELCEPCTEAVLDAAGAQ